MWHCWICGSVEWDINVKLDNTTEFVTLFNKCDCWRRWECNRDKTIDFVALLNTWNCWIRYDVKSLEYWICYIVDIVWTVDWDMIMKVNNTTEFVTLLNVWDCWMGWDCEIR